MIGLVELFTFYVLVLVFPVCGFIVFIWCLMFIILAFYISSEKQAAEAFKIWSHRAVDFDQPPLSYMVMNCIGIVGGLVMNANGVVRIRTTIPIL